MSDGIKPKISEPDQCAQNKTLAERKGIFYVFCTCLYLFFAGIVKVKADVLALCWSFETTDVCFLQLRIGLPPGLPVEETGQNAINRKCS